MNEKTICTTLDHLGLLSVKGEGAKKFLQGQLTCNLDEITPQQSPIGAHCNPQGRIISLFRLFFFQEQYYLQMPKELLPITMTALKKYAVFFKVTLEDATDTLMQIGYTGSELTDLPENTLHLQPDLANYSIIIGEPANLQNRLTSKSQTAIWKIKDITAGIPAIYPETSEKFLPHDLNLHKLQGISFNKGCYTGQEIIARMHYRAKLKNHMYLATIHSPPSPLQRGQEIFNDTDPCGNIVDFAEININTYNVLIIAPEADVKSGMLYTDINKSSIINDLTLPYSL